MMKKMMLAATVLAAGLGLALGPVAQAVQSPAAAQTAKAPPRSAPSTTTG